MHISQLIDKSANTLANVGLIQDAYHQAIQESARRLVNDGLGHMTYVTQYVSYTTVWRTTGHIISMARSN